MTKLIVAKFKSINFSMFIFDRNPVSIKLKSPRIKSLKIIIYFLKKKIL